MVGGGATLGHRREESQEGVLTDLALLEWASGWLPECPVGDPTFRARFLDGLLAELKARRAECAKACDDFAATVTGMKEYERGMRAGAAACAAKIRESGRGTPCEQCGAAGAEYGPDPYAEEIKGQTAPVWLCGNCRRQNTRDI